MKNSQLTFVKLPLHPEAAQVRLGDGITVDSEAAVFRHLPINAIQNIERLCVSCSVQGLSAEYFVVEAISDDLLALGDLFTEVEGEVHGNCGVRSEGW